MSAPDGDYPFEANYPEAVKVSVKVASELLKPSTDNLVETTTAFNLVLSHGMQASWSKRRLTPWPGLLA